jgi:hypothetical protein
MTAVFIGIAGLIWIFSSPSWASLNCEQQCPIDFRPSAPGEIPLQRYTERQNCLGRCEHLKNQEYQLQQQTEEMEKQTKLLEQNLEEQRKIKSKLEDLE